MCTTTEKIHEKLPNKINKKVKRGVKEKYITSNFLNRTISPKKHTKQSKDANMSAL